MDKLNCSHCIWYKKKQCPHFKNPYLCKSFKASVYTPPKLNSFAAIQESTKTNYRTSFYSIIERRYRIEKAGTQCLEDFKKNLQKKINVEFDTNKNITLQKELSSILDLWTIYELALKVMPGYVDDIVLSKIWETNKEVGLTRKKEHSPDPLLLDIGKIIKANYNINKDIKENTKVTNNLLTNIPKTITSLIHKISTFSKRTKDKE